MADDDGAAAVSDEHPSIVNAVTATIAPSRAQGVIARL
jgi:hypothetical protein